MDPVLIRRGEGKTVILKETLLPRHIERDPPSTLAVIKMSCRYVMAPDVAFLIAMVITGYGNGLKIHLFQPAYNYEYPSPYSRFFYIT